LLRKFTLPNAPRTARCERIRSKCQAQADFKQALIKFIKFVCYSIILFFTFAIYFKKEFTDFLEFDIQQIWQLFRQITVRAFIVKSLFLF